LAVFFVAIIFLTGCAARRYDTPTERGIVTLAPTPWPEQPFAWPLEGRVVGAYGSRERGTALKGILIEGAEGETARAALDGRVAFSDDALPGYGRTVIVEHAGGLTTVYARGSEILVRTGETVRRGTPLLRVGKDGKDSAPHLYFEVRRGARAEDPSRFRPR